MKKGWDIDKFLDSKYSIVILTVLIILINILLILMLVGGIAQPVLTLLLLIACNLVYITDAVILAKHQKNKREKLLDEYLDSGFNSLYLCGFKLFRYIETDSFSRFFSWSDNSFSQATSAIAMFLLKDNKTARLCQNTSLRNGLVARYHAWVEFKISPWSLHWYVLDLSWFDGYIDRKKFYEKCDNIEAKKICEYEDFWTTPSKTLYNRMCHLETSYVWDYLVNWARCIETKTFEIRLPGNCNEANMPPIGISRNKVCSSGTLRDFVKNPKRKRPKARTQRLAWSKFNKARKARY